MRASEYIYCPHCRGRFSFRSPIANCCCWCEKPLPFVRPPRGIRRKKAALRRLDRAVARTRERLADLERERIRALVALKC